MGRASGCTNRMCDVPGDSESDERRRGGGLFAPDLFVLRGRK